MGPGNHRNYRSIGIILFLANSFDGEIGKNPQFQSLISMFLGKLWSCGAMQYFRTNPHTIKWLAMYSITSSLWLVTILDFGWLNTVLTIINHSLYYRMNADPTFILPVIYPTISDTLTSTRFIHLYVHPYLK